MKNITTQELKDKLLKMADKSDSLDLKLAIVAQPLKTKSKGGYIDNPFFANLYNSFGRVLAQVQALVDDGLSFNAGDFYVYNGHGGIKVHESPKGVRKQLQSISKKYGLTVIVSDGVLYNGDTIEVFTDGLIDSINIVKDPKTLVMGGNIVAPYAVVSVFKGDNLVAKKLFVIPNSEYQKILAQGLGSNYPTMMAKKSVLKRVANSIYSLLGVALEKEDIDELNNLEKRLESDYKEDEATVNNEKIKLNFKGDKNE